MFKAYEHSGFIKSSFVDSAFTSEYGCLLCVVFLAPCCSLSCIAFSRTGWSRYWNRSHKRDLSLISIIFAILFVFLYSGLRNGFRWRSSWFLCAVIYFDCYANGFDLVWFRPLCCGVTWIGDWFTATNRQWIVLCAWNSFCRSRHKGHLFKGLASLYCGRCIYGYCRWFSSLVLSAIFSLKLYWRETSCIARVYRKKGYDSPASNVGQRFTWG